MIVSACQDFISIFITVIFTVINTVLKRSDKIMHNWHQILKNYDLATKNLINYKFTMF